jgi:hypothetical protein
VRFSQAHGDRMARVTKKAPMQHGFSSGRKDYGHNATAC